MAIFNISESLASSYRLTKANISVSGSIVGFDNYIRPKLTDFSRQSIQAFIKQKITQEKIRIFLDRNINERNIDDYRRFMENWVYKDLENTLDEKYMYDLALVLIYEEVFSPKKVLEIIQQQEGDALLIFEKMVVLEYELFLQNTSITETTALSNKIYILDNIPTILYGRKDVLSYRDLDNVRSEIQKIFDDALALESLTVSSALFNVNGILGEFLIANPDNPSERILNINMLARINQELSTIEKDENIYKYSFILNYNNTSTVFDQSMVRKHYGLTVPGYYFKDGNIETLSGISTYSYYPRLISFGRLYNSDYAKANSFLKTFWNLMVERTINYWIGSE